jgi:hypothetical protein
MMVGLGSLAGLVAAEPHEHAAPTKAPAPAPAARVAAPPVRIVLGPRAATADGRRSGLGYVSGPVVEVTQPRPDTVIVNMLGVVAVGGFPMGDSLAEALFDLNQQLRIEAKPGVEQVQLIMEAQLAGLMRSNRPGAGAVTVGPADAAVVGGGAPVLQVGFPSRTHTGTTTQFISDRAGPTEAIVAPGEYCLTQKFSLTGTHPKRCFHKNVATAMFAPEYGRPAEWLVLLDPTREAPKVKDLGFRVLLHVAPAPPAPVVLPTPTPLLPAPAPVVPAK